MQHFRPDHPRSGALAASFGKADMLASALACVTLPAHAVLGGLESGLVAEAPVLGPEVKARVQTFQDYPVHLFQSGSENLTVRQYAGPDGRIFGVARVPGLLPAGVSTGDIQ